MCTFPPHIATYIRSDNPQQEHIDEQSFDAAWGILDKRQASEAANAHYEEVLKEISDTPATTVNGILVKLEIWQRVELWTNTDSKALDDIDLEERTVYRHCVTPAGWPRHDPAINPPTGEPEQSMECNSRQ